MSKQDERKPLVARQVVLTDKAREALGHALWYSGKTTTQIVEELIVIAATRLYGYKGYDVD